MMKKCKTCHTLISHTAKPCPECGEKEPFRSNKFFIMVGLIAISLGIGLMFYFRSI